MRLPLYDASPPASRSATTPACSQAGGTKPVVRPACSAQSPIAWTRASSTERAGRRRRCRGARSGRRGGPARSTGRPPAVSTTRSVSSVKPLSSDQPRVGQPDGAGARVDGGAEPPQVAGEDRPAGASTWLRSRCSPPSTTSVSRPRTPAPGPPGGRAARRRRPPRSGRPAAAAIEAQAVVEAAERVHLLVQPAVHPDQAADRRQGGDAAGGQDQPVVGDRCAVGEHRPRAPRGRSRATRAPRRRSTPCSAYQPGIAQCQSTRAVGPLEHGGQQDPVVRRVGLVAEHGDVRRGRQLLDQPGRGHAGADDDRRHARTCAAGWRPDSDCRTSRCTSRAVPTSPRHRP